MSQRWGIRTRRFVGRLTPLLIVTTAVLLGAHHASADLKLRLTAGLDSVTITDGAGNDSCADPGCVDFLGPVGSFFVNVVSGSSAVTASSASLLLSSVNVSIEPGTLTIELTDTDFPATGAGELSADVSGVTFGTASFGAHKNASNAEFATSDALALGFGPLAGPLADGGSTSHDPLGSYSMTLKATIVHGSGTLTTTFDFGVTNVTDGDVRVPEPGTLVILGLGLVTVGTIARRRKGR